MDEEEAAVHRVHTYLVQLMTGTPWQRRDAAEALAQMRDQRGILPSVLSDVTDLIQTLEHKSADRLRRQSAAWALGLIGNPQGIPALVEALKDADTGVDMEAAKALTKIKDPQTVSALNQAIKDNSIRYPVRQEAAKALGTIGNPQAVLALIQILEDEKEDWQVHYQVANALGRSQDPQAVPALTRVLKDKNENWLVRSEAAEALAGIEGPQAVPILVEALWDKRKQVRWQAARSLTEIARRHPDPVLRTALPALRRLQKRNPAFQEALEQIEVATAEFRNLPVPASAPPLDARLLPRPAAVPNDRKVTALIAGLKEGDPSRRYFAAEALRAIGDPYAVPALIETLSDKKEYRPIRGEAAKALGAIGGPQSIQALIDSLKDKKRGVSRQAARALKEIAQHHPDPALRAALPLLRRFRERDPAFREALEQIEAVTGAFKDLPMPASAPPPDARTLPRPAAMSSHASAPMPHGWWLRLRRALKGS